MMDICQSLSTKEPNPDDSADATHILLTEEMAVALATAIRTDPEMTRGGHHLDLGT